MIINLLDISDSVESLVFDIVNIVSYYLHY